MNDVIIVNGARSPIGRFGGSLKDIPAVELGAIAIKEALKRSKIGGQAVDDVIMGAIHQEGMGNNPARIAALKAEIPHTAGALTVNNVCSSGMKAIEIAAHQIQLGKADIVIAGGMESNSQTPYLLLKNRWGNRLGNHQIEDALFYDGFKDVFGEYGGYDHVGETAENLIETAEAVIQKYNLLEFNIDKEEINRFAIDSQKKYFRAKENGFFTEIVPVKVKKGHKEQLITEDESPRKDVTLDKLNKLRPAFREKGFVTAGNTPDLNDGAAALVLMSDKKANELGITPLGIWKASSQGNVEPDIMGIGPIVAIRNILEDTKFTLDQIDLFEINEAQAQQVLFCVKALQIPLEKVNVNGGSIAIGHPPGMTGARLILTALHELLRREGKYAICSQCAGGGTGMATLIERFQAK